MRDLPGKSVDRSGRERPVLPSGARAETIAGVQVIRDGHIGRPNAISAENLDRLRGTGSLGDFVLGTQYDCSQQGPFGFNAQPMGPAEFPGTTNLRKVRLKGVRTEAQVQEEQAQQMQSSGGHVSIPDKEYKLFAVLGKRDGQELFSGAFRLVRDEVEQLCILRFDDLQGNTLQAGDELVLVDSAAADPRASIQAGRVMAATPAGGGMNVVLQLASKEDKQPS